MKTTLFKLLTVLLVLGGMAACDTPRTMTDSEAAKWIAAYTPERISAGSAIRIELTDSMRLLCPDTLSGNILHFSPGVKGELRFTAKRLLEFLPQEGALKPGQEYTCRVRLSKLAKTDSLRDFAFTFFVAERKTQLQVTDMRVDPDDIRYMQIEGNLVFSEPVEASQVVAGLLHGDLQGVPAHPVIESTGDPARFRFIFPKLKRSEEETRLQVSFDAGQLNFDAPEPQEIAIPKLREFKLLSAERHDAVQPYIGVEFSAPLSPEQELDGLITIDRLDRVRIERKGTNVKVFYDPKGLTDIVLRVSELVRCQDGQTLAGEVEQHFKQEVIPPAVEIPLHGTILPDGRNLTLPFRAVNLAAVDVEVVKIYADNLMAFLQDNEINTSYRLRRFGRLIFKRTVRLDKDKSLDLHRWQHFSVDLKNLFRQERGAIYNIRLSFRKAYSLYDRTEAADFRMTEGMTAADRDRWDENYAYIDWKAPDYDWGEYEWEERDDPSKASYYMESDRMPEYNLAASDLGLIVKRADGEQLWTAVSDLMTAAPLAGVRVTAYNYQLREIGSALTDAQGFADFKVRGNPFIVTASDGVSTTYLKPDNGRALSTSRFDVGGERILQGVKGFVYGERGVWRPGDEMHLTLIVEDKQHALPANHPVTMELYTPKEQLYDRKTLTESVDGIYVFHVRTSDDAPTGCWDAQFKFGGQTFHYPVRIETIKPNRLKINIASPELLCAGDSATIGVGAHWLTGPVAAGMRTKVEMVLFNNPRPFEQYGDYVFSNPLYAFSFARHDVLEGRLDSLGRISVPYIVALTVAAPGMMQANLIARVFEAGGDESLTSRSVRYSPYDTYVGIALGDRNFETDCDLHFPVVTVDSSGRRLSGRELEYKIYRLDWSWWWEGSADDLRRYVQSTSADVVVSGTMKSVEGRAEILFRLEYPARGKYLVIVRDTKSGHATGGVVFIDWPDWRGHSGKSDPTAATMLSFSLDKRNYEAGDVATVYLPKSAGGRVLLSVENGSRVLSRRWVRTSADKETACRLPVTRDMAPNFYVHAMLLLPHAQTANGLPIRMYGIERADVIDRRTILHPEIEVAGEIRPQQAFTVRVREKEGKPMSYTLAIVDEGLLDITSYRTPQPWPAMNRREALGVRTWDMYNDVVGAWSGKFTSILSIGGDEALRQAAGKEKRFNPVVKFLGPFTLAKGTKTHRITLPMYVGSVRVMVVAAHAGSYGQADKTVTVRSPLMLLPTLPRTLACGDRVKMPVNVFAMEQGVGDVRVDVAVEGPLAVAGSHTRMLSFTGPSEQLTDFGLVCDKTKSGWAKVIVTATGGGRTASDTVRIGVRNPLPDLLTSQSRILRGGESCQVTWPEFTAGEARLELATMPVINFSGAFSFVENYAHYCTEQLSSRAMYMLYARRFLDAGGQRRAEAVLPELLKAIVSRQLANGGFAYWPGNTVAHDWVTSMAGEVMTEARRQGFAINSQCYDRWAAYQLDAARRYRHTTDGAAGLRQAYRLYTLALAGKELPAAMNRLRESKSLSGQTLLRLAAAYAVAGRTDAASALAGRAGDASFVDGDYTTFWSPLRDRAMAAEAWLLTGHTDQAFGAARKIADDFSATCCSTQEVAFISAAMSRLADVAKEAESEVAIAEEGKTRQILRNFCGVKQFVLDPSKGVATVENRGKGEIALALTTSRRPSAEETVPATAEGVTVEVSYTDLEGHCILPDSLKQGDEFIAKILVKKSGENSGSMALTYALPSGWEIWNGRLAGDAERTKADYTDIRDERINWYFSLNSGQSTAFTVRLRAAYCGRFMLPPTVCEDMYCPQCRAVTANRYIEVVK